MVYYFVFDLETGGLDETKNPICQIAMIILDSNLVKLETFCSYVNNYDNLKYTSEAMRINNITKEQVKSGISARALKKKIIELSSKYIDIFEKPILVGHNIDMFDIKFLKYLFLRKDNNDIYDFFQTKTYDTLKLSRERWKNSPNDLQSVCNRLYIILENAHDALGDTVATVKVFRYLTLIN